jgi:hypothetical protein
MRRLADLEKAISDVDGSPRPTSAARELLGIGEEVLEHWIRARDEEPTREQREGFRLLALHRQGTRDDPSFNACRESCRELAYYYNLVTLQPEHTETTNRVEMMKLITSHLYLFVSGKMQVAELGEFCCSARPIRSADSIETGSIKEA